MMKKKVYPKFLLFLLFIFLGYSKENIIQQKIRIINSSGKSEFRLIDKQKWDPLTKDTRINTGWDIKTNKDSHLKLSIEPAITAYLDESSLLRLNKLLINHTKKAIRMRMVLLDGLLAIQMPSIMGYKLLYTIETPSATIYLRNAVIRVRVENSATTLEVDRGVAKVRHNENELKTMVYAGSRARVEPFKTAVNIEMLTADQETIAHQKEDEVSVAILSIRSKVASKTDLEPVSDFVAQEIEKQSNTEVLFLDDVRAMLRAEGVQNILNCITDSCISKIGSFLGVDMVVIGKLGKLGSQYIFNLKMIDVLRDKTKKRVNVTVENDMGLILNEVPDLVNNLIQEKRLISVAGSNQLRKKYVSTLKLPKKEKSGMEYIFKGTLNMGSEMNMGDMDEWPKHKVTLNDFYIDKYEVTKEEFEQIMGYNPSAFKGCKTCPVDNVTWAEAHKYCEKIGKRLPTEAEWEYACRGGTNTEFHYGNTLSSNQANFNGQRPYGGAPIGSAKYKPIPVGSYKPNKWKLFDMHGNVGEWCADWYSETYYGNSSSENPQGPKQGKYKVLRGGSWRDEGKSLRSANRVSYSPMVRLNTIGFRCVKDVSP